MEKMGCLTSERNVMSADKGLSAIERLLNQERTRVSLKIAQLRESLQSNIDPDLEDGASELEAHEHSSALLQELERQEKSLELALEKIRRGTYGLCENCGTPIDPARLEAMPETTLCLQCKLASERQS